MLTCWLDDEQQQLRNVTEIRNRMQEYPDKIIECQIEMRATESLIEQVREDHAARSLQLHDLKETCMVLMEAEREVTNQ
jgi:hypothetical protein